MNNADVAKQQPQHRIALCLEYDGSNYHGWQQQDIKLPTVQQTLQAALTKLANEPIKVSCAGRTDVGVHAVGQVIHFDTTKERRLDTWVLGGNTNLPCDIRIYAVKKMPLEFHARFSAVSRHYKYIIHNVKRKSALLHNKVLWHYNLLDADIMHKALELLLGEHDFSSFRASSCQSLSAKRCITKVNVRRRKDFIIIDIAANAFLHHMVRNIIGGLLLVGEKKSQPEWLGELMAKCDRTLGAKTAAACGLYLWEVKYPEAYGISMRESGSCGEFFAD